METIQNGKWIWHLYLPLVIICSLLLICKLNISSYVWFSCIQWFSYLLPFSTNFWCYVVRFESDCKLFNIKVESFHFAFHERCKRSVKSLWSTYILPIFLKKYYYFWIYRCYHSSWAPSMITSIHWRPMISK